MNALEFLHAVEEFLRRDLSEEEYNAVIRMHEDGYEDVQDMADLLMTKEDFRRVYG